jgi:ubiquinone/menaquinone biosynthesis C-methylase UbiE
MHELEEPERALNELMRVLHPEGILLIADFNDRGFEVMQRLEREIYGRDHPRGSMPMAEVERMLHTGAGYEKLETRLNVAVVAGPRR